MRKVELSAVTIEIAVYRMRIGLDYSRQINVKGLEYLDYFESLVIMALLLLSGIERNPGPLSHDSVGSVATIHDKSNIKDKFSVVHNNVQSISNKIDLLESELMNFDVICITETWLDNRTSDDVLVLDGYKLYRRDRVGDSDGVSVFMLNKIVILVVERIWNYHILNVFGWKFPLTFNWYILQTPKLNQSSTTMK